MFETQLFEGQRVRFAAPDPDKHAETEAKWTEDIDYLRALNVRPAYPLGANVIKKQYEADRKEAEKDRLFRWAVCAKEDDRLVGWAKLSSFEWTHGTAQVALAIGAAADRGKGFGSDALRLALRFAFDELNLHRLTASVAGHNAGALRFFPRFGFVEEIRRRQALLLEGQRYDEVWFGLLRREWQP